MTDNAYSKVKLNSVNRLRNRATYDYETIHGIVNSSPVVHVSFAAESSEPFPTILPMIGQMGSFESSSAGLDVPLDCYLHGYISSRIMKLSQEAIAQGEEGLPVCIAATRVDGYVLALTPFHHSYNYRSAVLHGYAQVVEGDDEKLWAMQLITNSVVPERWENTRTPPNKVERDSTKILRIRVVAGSGKVRVGVPHDDRADLKDELVRGKYWAGVVPTWEVMGEPISAPDNVVDVPVHVKSFIQDLNGRNKEIALEAARQPK